MEIVLAPDLILSHETVKKIIKKKADHLGNIIDMIELKPMLNLMEPIYGKRSKYATIKFLIPNHSIIQNLSPNYLRVFLKIRHIENINNQFNIVKTLGLFYREIEIYSSVFPQILQSEDEDIVPKFFHAENDVALVIEDMNSKNYTAINKMRSLDLSHCVVVLKCLARFHARTIIHHHHQKMKTSLIGYTRKYSVTEKMMIHQPESYLRVYFTAIGHSLSENFHLIKELQTLDYKKFKLIFLEMVDKFFEIVTHPDFSKIAVLCHSDLVASNLLFRYNENNEPLTCCFIDFQFTKYSSPAYDLWGFFYMNTTKEMRNERMDVFCKIYHETLSKILNENHVDSYLFSYPEFKDMMKKDQIYGLIQGILNLYEEFRQELKCKYGKNYRDIMPQLWKDSLILSRQNFEKYRNYKKRIIDEIIELYSMIMPTTTILS